MIMERVVDEFVEIELNNPDDFLKIKETLTRIGVASRKGKTLYQSCHILHKRQKYYITHFKELFILDGRESNFTDDDKARRNTIVNLLAEWGLVIVLDESKIQTPVAPLSNIKVLPFKYKNEWDLRSKYTIGRK